MFKGKSKPTLFACFDPTSVTIPPELADLYTVPTDIAAFWVATFRDTRCLLQIGLTIGMKRRLAA
jgi:hypothetical protein